MIADFVIAVSVADIHREADAASELVTQALMNAPVQAGQICGDWTYVTLSDYAGWIRSDELELPIVRGICEGEGTCGIALPYSVVVTVPHTPLYTHAEGTETCGELYLATVLPYIDLVHPQRLRVALPDNNAGWLAREAVDIRSNNELFPRQELATITANAKAFLGVPYLWGGTSWRGIDCSGFVQLCYRMGGYNLPRDADQQHNFLKRSIKLEDVQAGDLIFFGKTQITHVAMLLNRHEYIHAEGQQHNQVIIYSLDPAHPAYHAGLKERIWDIKRVRQE